MFKDERSRGEGHSKGEDSTGETGESHREKVGFGNLIWLKCWCTICQMHYLCYLTFLGYSLKTYIVEVK